jgi:hypothetical protein
MTQQGYRHRIIVQDRSGSMDEILEGAQSGLGEFLAGEASAPGKVTISLWDFDTEIRCVHAFGHPEAVRSYRIEPRGGTAMYDAIGKALTEEGRKLEALPEDERPEDVTVIIASDGLENRSQDYSGQQVKEMLEHQQGYYKWRVIYMGCNQDALKEGGRIGTKSGLTVNTVGTSTGQRNAWKMSSGYLRRAPVAMAASGQGSINFTPGERALGESAEEPGTGEE